MEDYTLVLMIHMGMLQPNLYENKFISHSKSYPNNPAIPRVKESGRRVSNANFSAKEKIKAT